MRKDSQIPVINMLRGMAAAAVCLYHFVVTTTGYIQSKVLLDVFQYGKYGVELFFIISGIVIPLSMIKSEYRVAHIHTYLLRRFVRIEPPYLVAVALGILFLYVRNFIPSSTPIDFTPSIRDVLLHLGYLVPFVPGAKWINPVFWTLAVEFQYYLFLAILFPLALSGRASLRWAFNLIVILVPFLISSTKFFPYWSAYFGFGIFYALYITQKYSLREFIMCAVLCASVVYVRQGALDIGIAIGALSIIHFIPDHRNMVGMFLGKISYSLYLMHTVVGSGFVNFMSHRFSSPVEKFVVMAMGLALSIGAAYILWKLVERPSQLLSRKYSTPRSKFSPP